MSGCHHVGPCQCICHKPNGKVKCLLCNCREETDITQMKEDIKKLNDIAKNWIDQNKTHWDRENTLFDELKNLSIKYKINRNVQDMIYSEIEKIKLELKMKNKEEIICPHCTQVAFQGSR